MNLIKLNNDLTIPEIGIGTYKVSQQKEINQLIEYSYKYGYRMIDTASFYNNELLIGNFFKYNPSIAKDIVISTKVWPVDYKPDNVKKSIENSLMNLNLNTIPILLLHWPSDGYIDAWKVLEDYYEQGVLKSIAVSNFHKNHLEKLFVKANISPVFDQVELHPYLIQRDLTKYLNANKINIAAWAPLAKGNSVLFSEEILVNLSIKYKKTVAQIILKWHLQNNRIIIPKSTNPIRIKENIEIYDFNLLQEELFLIDSLNKNYRISKNPDDLEWLDSIR